MHFGAYSDKRGEVAKSMKFAGILLIILGGVFIGMKFVYQMNRRIDILSDVVLSLNVLLNEISFGRTAFEDIFSRLGKINGDTGDFYKNCCEDMKTVPRIPLDEIWQMNIEKLFRGTASASRERDIMVSLGHELGMSDYNAQVRSISYAIKELSDIEKEARNISDKKCRMYMGLSVALSAMVVIIAV